MIPMRERALPSVLLFFLVCLMSASASAQDGIAKKYPRDVGIANDPNVIFAETFDAGTLSDIVNRWSDGKNVAGMSLVPDPAPGSVGTRALQITSIGGTNTGGHLYKRL